MPLGALYQCVSIALCLDAYASRLAPITANMLPLAEPPPVQHLVSWHAHRHEPSIELLGECVSVTAGVPWQQVVVAGGRRDKPHQRLRSEQERCRAAHTGLLVPACLQDMTPLRLAFAVLLGVMAACLPFM